MLFSPLVLGTSVLLSLSEKHSVNAFIKHVVPNNPNHMAHHAAKAFVPSKRTLLTLLTSDNADQSSFPDTVSSKSKRKQLQQFLHTSIGRVRGGATSESPDASKQETEPSSSNPHNILQGFMFSGNLLPSIRHVFAGSSESYARGWNAIKEFHNFGDITVLAIFSLAPIPLFKAFHRIYYELAMKFGKKQKEYEDSKLSAAGRLISQGGQIASLVYFVEMLSTLLVAILAGMPKAAATAAKSPQQVESMKHLLPLQKFPDLFANCAYGIWIARKFILFKSRILKKYFSRLPDPETYDRFLDFLIYLTAAIFVLDASSFDLGALVKSLVAVGGLSSIVVGLALKEPATQLLQGALLMAVNKFRKNETIRLGDGTEGKVVDIGLLETTLMGGDDIEVKIPNSKLSGQKFSNISRMRRSRIKFDLKFNIYDMHRVQEIASSIKQEILDACPKLITDGSRPFRVIWTDVGDDHLVVTVHTHHNVPPSCTEHWATREQVLYAIARATEKLGVKFAMPVCVNADFRVSE